MGNNTDAFKELRDAIENSYKHHFLEAYRLAGGNVSTLARGLGISRGTAHTYIKKNFGDNYRSVILHEVNRTTFYKRPEPLEEARQLVTNSARGVF